MAEIPDLSRLPFPHGHPMFALEGPTDGKYTWLVFVLIPMRFVFVNLGHCHADYPQMYVAALAAADWFRVQAEAWKEYMDREDQKYRDALPLPPRVVKMFELAYAYNVEYYAACKDWTTAARQIARTMMEKQA